MNAGARRLLAAAALLAALAIIIGAFGAHALRARLDTAHLQTLETGVRYHFLGALGLFGIGLLALQPGAPRHALRAGALIAAGVVVFSGSLYALALGAPRGFGAITPLGGVAMIGGWLWLAWQLWRTR